MGTQSHEIPALFARLEFGCGASYVNFPPHVEYTYISGRKDKETGNLASINYQSLVALDLSTTDLFVSRMYMLSYQFIGNHRPDLQARVVVVCFNLIGKALAKIRIEEVCFSLV